jgi:acyl-CoA synthetase (AMP-forming)/AMP-acid ligase II
MTKLDCETTTKYGANLSYGRRPLARVIDDVASETPSRPFAFVPCSQDPRDGWKAVSFKMVANAINFVAHRMTRELEPNLSSNGTFPTVAYVGPNDLRYFILMVACLKVGYQAFFISPRNSIEGQLSLFKATDSRVLYFASSHRTMVQPWLQGHDMQAIEVSSIDVWLETQSSPFPYCKTSAEAEWDPLVVLHSSGSTGIPKPIVIRQGCVQVADALQTLPKFHGAEFFLQAFAKWPSMVFLPMPLFHAAGILMMTILGVYYDVKLALSVPERPLTSDLMMQCLEHSGADAAMMPPAIIEDLSTTEQGLRVLEGLKFLAFGGGKYPVRPKMVPSCMTNNNLQ